MTSPRVLVAALVAALGLAGCGAAGGPAPVAAAPTPTAEQPERFRASGLVLEDATHGPQLCEMAAQSNPPQCAGLDIVGWSWADIAHAARNGSRFGDYEMVGTYDGERLTLAEPPGPRRHTPRRSSPDFSSPCPAPAGGWRVVDDAKATDAVLQQAQALVERTPDAAGAWVTLADDDTNNPKTLVFNARFTGDLAVHEHRLRLVWGGALCVAPAKHSTADLERIRSQLEESLPGVIRTGTDVTRNRVTVRLYVATEDVRRDVEARYGPGVVELDPFLEPVPR